MRSVTLSIALHPHDCALMTFHGFHEMTLGVLPEKLTMNNVNVFASINNHTCIKLCFVWWVRRFRFCPSGSWVDELFARPSGSSLQKRENFLVFFRSKIGADAHVHRGDLPLRRAVVARRPDVMTANAIFGPELCTAFFCCWRSSSDRNLSRFRIAGAADQPAQSGTGDNDRSSGEADPFPDPQNIFFHD